jgi:hypothetical protein
MLHTAFTGDEASRCAQRITTCGTCDVVCWLFCAPLCYADDDSHVPQHNIKVVIPNSYSVRHHSAPSKHLNHHHLLLLRCRVVRL